MTFDLPWPPSVNHYWRSARGRVYISAEGDAYRLKVLAAVSGRRGACLAGRVAVDIAAYPPDRRRRDLDNTLKALLDALQAAGVYEDDSQIDSLAVQRFGLDPAGRGRVVVNVRAIERAGP